MDTPLINKGQNCWNEGYSIITKEVDCKVIVCLVRLIKSTFKADLDPVLFMFVVGK